MRAGTERFVRVGRIGRIGRIRAPLWLDRPTTVLVKNVASHSRESREYDSRECDSR